MRYHIPRIVYQIPDLLSSAGWRGIRSLRGSGGTGRGSWRGERKRNLYGPGARKEKGTGHVIFTLSFFSKLGSVGAGKPRLAPS